MDVMKIKGEIIKLRHKVKYIINSKNRHTKEQLHLFSGKLDPVNNSKAINKINRLQN